MSDLLKEDDEYLYLRQYVHHDSDSYSEWMIDDPHGDWKLKYTDEIIMAADSACYEIKVTYRVRKSDAKVFYDEIIP